MNKLMKKMTFCDFPQILRGMLRSINDICVPCIVQMLLLSVLAARYLRSV